MLFAIQYRFYLKTYIKRGEIHVMIHSGTDTVSVLKHKSYLRLDRPPTTKIEAASSSALRTSNLAQTLTA
jgi:hypothetical protein